MDLSSRFQLEDSCERNYQISEVAYGRTVIRDHPFSIDQAGRLSIQDFSKPFKNYTVTIDFNGL